MTKKVIKHVDLVEATGKYTYNFAFHMRLVSFDVRSVVTLLKRKLRNELLSF